MDAARAGTGVTTQCGVRASAVMISDDDVFDTAMALLQSHELVTVQTVAQRLGTDALSDVERCFQSLQETSRVSKGLAASRAGFVITYEPNG
jgi:predicted transcriptional regulator